MRRPVLREHRLGLADRPQALRAALEEHHRLVAAALQGGTPYGRRLLAGVMRHTRGDARWPLVAAIVKVRAHQTLDGLEGEQLLDATANALADTAAKNGLFK